MTVKEVFELGKVATRIETFAAGIDASNRIEARFKKDLLILSEAVLSMYTFELSSDMPYDDIVYKVEELMEMEGDILGRN